jgi:hypothetical protein
LYGLKQAPRAWYSRIDSYLQSIGFNESDVDLNLYLLIKGEDILILVLYVDDLFLTGAETLTAACKQDLAKEFEMKDIGLMHYFLGLEDGSKRVRPSWVRESTQLRSSKDLGWRTANP